MKLTRPVTLAAAVLVAAGALYAFQDGTRFPGERQATTSTIVDAASGDEIVMTYNTIQFGPQVTQMMMNAPAERREGMAMQFIPSRLRGEFETDVDLAFGDRRLEAGSYGVTFIPNDEGGIHIRFLTDGQSVLEAACDSRETSEEHRFLNFNLRSTGSETFRLEMDYGTVKAALDLSLAEMEEEEG